MSETIEEVQQRMFAEEKKDKVRRYKHLNQYVKKGEILFVGSSLMEQFPIYELLLDYNVRKTIYNRGIGGFTTYELEEVLDTLVFELEPSKIFINIGTNDINLPNFTTRGLIERYENILRKIMKRLPKTRIYVMAYYPVNGVYDYGNDFMKEALKVRSNEKINEVNQAVSCMAERLNLCYIDVNENLKDEDGNLKHNYSIEGMHMYADGYKAVFDELLTFLLEP